MDKDKAVDQAWDLAIEALTSGKLTLPSGKIIQLSERDMLKHVQWFAQINKGRVQGFPVLKDIHVRETAKAAKKEP